MKKRKSENRIPGIITIGLVLVLFVAVFFLMQYVQSLLNSDVKINLTEIATQNKDVITSKLKVELNNLDNKANQVADILKKKPTVSTDTIKESYFEYISESPDEDLFVAASDGSAWFSNGSVINIAGRQYFRLAMEGSQNISDRIISRVDGEELFAISVPLYIQGEVVGTVQQQYTPEEMYSLCSLSLFSDQGSIYIINSDGYILISSDQNFYNSESDNYYRSLYQDGNREESKTFESNIRDNKSG
ncbi:MAG: cache domain-containing protein, partial [Eubacterium sp.]